MKPFIKISIKFLKSNKTLSIACFISIIFTVVLLVSMNNFSYYIKHGYEQQLLEEYGDFDLYITGVDQKPMEENFVHKVEHLENIAGISQGVYEFITIDEQSIYAVGIQNDSIMKSRYKHTKDIGENEVIITDIYAKVYDLSEGDELEFNGETFYIIEILGGESYSVDSIYLMLFQVEKLQQLIGKENYYDFVAIQKAPSYSNQDVEESIRNLNKDIEVSVIDEEEYYIKSVQTMFGFVTFLSVVVLLIAALLTASIYVRYLEKSRDIIHILKSIGGTPNNLKEIMRNQTLFITGVACCCGFFLAFAMNQPMIKWLTEEGKWLKAESSFRYTSSIGITFIVFLFIYSMMTFFVARLVKNLSGSNSEEKSIHPRRRLIRYMILFLCLMSYIIIVIKTYADKDVVLPMLICLAILLVGFSILFASIIHKVLEKGIHLSKKLRLHYARIALQLIVPQIKENIFIILGITLIVVYSFVGGNLNRILIQNSIGYYESEYLTENKVTPRGIMNYQESLPLIDELNQKGLQPIYFFQTQTSTLNLNGEYFNEVYYLTSFDALKSIGMLENDIDNENVILSSEFAQKSQLTVGDRIKLPVGYVNQSREQSEVQANKQVEKLLKEAKEYVIGDIIDVFYFDILLDVSQDQYIIDDSTYLDSIYLNVEHPNIEESLNLLSSKYPIEWSSLSEVLEYGMSLSKDQWRVFQICFYLLSIIIGFGFMNSLINMINCRVKEYKILHSLGVPPNHLVRIILIQVFIFISLGLVFGTAIGIFIISNLNFVDTKEWMVTITLNEVITIFAFLVVMSFGTYPTIRKLVKKIR